jgi:hypothetical protein
MILLSKLNSMWIDFRFFMFGKLSLNKGCEVSHPMNYKLFVCVLLCGLVISIVSNVNLVVFDKFACYNKCLFPSFDHSFKPKLQL